MVDIHPVDRQYLERALAEAFPGLAVDAVTDGDQFATR
jgi:hypothetical protein